MRPLVYSKAVEAGRLMADPRVINGGGNEWYTPPQYIEAAREVMGGIDLDPASNDIAAQWINATSYYTITDNGLAKSWEGRVWMNPPYSQPLISQFFEKLLSEFEKGTVSEAIALTNNNTDTAWFHQVMRDVQAVCFTRGRIKFLFEGTNKKASPTQGQVFYYLGPAPQRFVEVFSQFGTCLLASPNPLP